MSSPCSPKVYNLPCSLWDVELLKDRAHLLAKKMSDIKVCRRLDLNCGPLASEATALPTEPQPKSVKAKIIFFIDRCKKFSVNFGDVLFPHDLMYIDDGDNNSNNDDAVDDDDEFPETHDDHHHSVADRLSARSLVSTSLMIVVYLLPKRLICWFWLFLKLIEDLPIDHIGHTAAQEQFSSWILGTVLTLCHQLCYLSWIETPIAIFLTYTVHRILT